MGVARGIKNNRIGTVANRSVKGINEDTLTI